MDLKKELFMEFVERHCYQGKSYWTHIDLLITAFDDFCADRQVEKLKAHQIVDLATELLDARIRGTRLCKVLIGVQVKSYPGCWV